MDTTFETLHGKKAGKDEWLTPPSIIAALGPFDLDPCAPIDRPWDTARRHYTIEDDGLLQRWDGFVWCNPPYGKRLGEWLEKCAMHGNGIAMTFARVDTLTFQRHVFPRASILVFLQGRIKFFNANGRPAPFNGGAPSCLIGYGEEAKGRLLSATRSGRINGWCMKVCL